MHSVPGPEETARIIQTRDLSSWGLHHQEERQTINTYGDMIIPDSDNCSEVHDAGK